MDRKELALNARQFHGFSCNRGPKTRGCFQLWCAPHLEHHDSKPQATCFDYLHPSATSGRFLGVEIDTRELVLVDHTFHVAKRFDVTFRQRRRCELFWSPDEKTAVGRLFLEHPSDEWEGFRIDLETGEIQKLDVGFQTDRFVFPNEGNELFESAGQ